MKNTVKKIITIGLCASIAVGAACGTAFAVNYDKSHNKTVENINTNRTSISDNKTDIVKNETVYVIANADGTVKKIIVSDWIKNTIGASDIKDKSDLTNIENVKGDESYTVDNDNAHVWDAEGNDIYYQGNIEKELPVGITVSYKLDGKPISATELAGKSGKVTIRFDYKNNQFQTVEIDGNKEKIYVPFAMLTGMLLDGNSFRNIELTNGKLINDGDHVAVIGIAFPGLQENLALSSEQIEIPDFFEITADVKNFEMTNTVTIAANKVFNAIDTDKLNSIDDLTSALDEMSDAVNQLIDGSSKLYDGLTTLLDKSQELINGITQLAEGAEKLKNGADSLNNGASEIANGAKDLADGLNAIASNNANLNNGAKQIFNSLLSMADSQLSAAGITAPKLTIENYSSVLKNVITSLSDTKSILSQAQTIARQKVTEAVNAQRNEITAKVTDAVRKQVSEKVYESVKAEVEIKVTESVRSEVIKMVTDSVEKEIINKVTAAVRQQIEEAVIAAINMTKEEYDAAVKAGLITAEQQAKINAEIDARMLSDEVKLTIQNSVNSQITSDAIKTAINDNVNAQMKTDSVAKMITDNIALQMNSEAVINLISDNINNKMNSADIKNTINANTNEQVAYLIEQNMKSKEVQDQINNSVNIAKEGITSINGLISQLDSYKTFYTGLNQYTAGVASAKDGANALSQGADQLKDGATELNLGMNELYNGIIKIKDGAPALIDGVSQLQNGSMQLSDGLKEFNEKGIKKLSDIVHGDIAGLVTRIKATTDVSKSYKSFSGISDDMDGDVKFIYRTDSIEIKK